MKRQTRVAGVAESQQPRQEEFFIKVCVQDNRVEKDRHVRKAEVTASVGLPIPDPPVTVAEMQDVAFAAKMALCRVLARRKKRGTR